MKNILITLLKCLNVLKISGIMSSENHFRNMYLKHLQRFGNVAQTFQQMFCKPFIPPLKNVMNMFAE